MNREEASKIDYRYADILNIERHHDHEIIKDPDGLPRWKEDPEVVARVESIGITQAVLNLYFTGKDKNSEEYRKLYRGMGYSLRGYWEVFYWEVNNPDAVNYKPEIK